MAGSKDMQLNTGQLSPESAEKFIALMVENVPLFKAIHTFPAAGSTGSHPLLNVGLNKTRVIARGTAATLVNAAEISLSYTLKEAVLPIVIPDSFVEDVDGDPDKIAEQVAIAYGSDLQVLLMCGDTAHSGSGDYHDMVVGMDGLIKKLTAYGSGSQAINCSGASTVAGKLKLLMAGTADHLLADPARAFLVSPSNFTSLWDEHQTTKTLLKEVNGEIYYRGCKVIQIPGVTKIVFANPKHIIVPIKRDIFVEHQRYPEARGYKTVVSSRTDIAGAYANMVIEA